MKGCFKICLFKSLHFNSIEELTFKKTKKSKSAFCANVNVQHFLCSNMQMNFPVKVSLWWHRFLFDSEIIWHYLAYLQQGSSISKTWWGPNYLLTLLLSPGHLFILPVRHRADPRTYSCFLLTGAKKFDGCLSSLNFVS